MMTPRAWRWRTRMTQPMLQQFFQEMEVAKDGAKAESLGALEPERPLACNPCGSALHEAVYSKERPPSLGLPIYDAACGLLSISRCRCPPEWASEQRFSSASVLAKHQWHRDSQRVMTFDTFWQKSFLNTDSKRKIIHSFQLAQPLQLISP